MSSPKSINSVLDQYEPSIEPVEPYNEVLDERNALREQNQQLWRIIEKQRVIIHQLHKITRANISPKTKSPVATSFPQQSPNMSGWNSEKDACDAGLTSPLPDDELHPRISILQSDQEDTSKPSSPCKDMYLEQDYTRAHKVQSVLSERFQNEFKNSESYKNPLYRTQNPHRLRKTSEGSLIQGKEQYRFPQKDQSPFFHKNASDSTLSHSSPLLSTSHQDSMQNLKPSSIENVSVLTVPRRSSLRIRRDNPPKNQSTNQSNKNIPDLRKTVFKDKDNKTTSLLAKEFTQFSSHLNHPTALDFIKEASLSDTTSSSHPSNVEQAEKASQSPKKEAHFFSKPETQEPFSSDLKNSPESSLTNIKSSNTTPLPLTTNSGDTLNDSELISEEPSTQKVLLPFSSQVRNSSSKLSEPAETLNEHTTISTDPSKLYSYSNSRVLRMVPEEAEHSSEERIESPTSSKKKIVHARSLSQGLNLFSSHTPESNPDQSPGQEIPLRQTRNRKTTIMQCIDSSDSTSSVDKRLLDIRNNYTQVSTSVSIPLTTPIQESISNQNPHQIVNITLAGFPSLLPSQELGSLPPTPQDLWCVQKTWGQLVALDNQLNEDFPHFAWPTLPAWPVSDKTIEQFLNSILNLALGLVSEAEFDEELFLVVGDFLITNSQHFNTAFNAVVEHPIPQKVVKSGNMLKRGKKFGKLKLRYFVVSGPTLEYFESFDGFYLGDIHLLGAQIIRSMVASLHSEAYEHYVYAITIMEPKKNNLVKHTFFVNNPIDWNEWILALDYYSRLNSDIPSIPVSTPSDNVVAAPRRIRSHDSLHSESIGRNISDKMDPPRPVISPRKISIDVLSSQRYETEIPSTYSSTISLSQSYDTPPASSPTNSSTRFESKPAASKSKMQEFMDGVKGHRKETPVEKTKPKSKSGGGRKGFQWNTKLFGDTFQKKSQGPTKVFGVPLEQAIAQAPIKAGYQIPAVLHRCIEYLEYHEAYLEEGIYRLSGSAANIQHLKEKFDNDGDYNLIKSGQRYDVHTVAGLLKLYLREMPNYVLTVELQPEFVKAVESPLRHHRVNEIGRLVCALPLANYTLLRTLTAHLIRIVEKADINKMTLRNIGIVFVPTLAVPAGVFSLMVVEFEYIFWVNECGAAQPKTLDPIIDENVSKDKETNQPESVSVSKFDSNSPTSVNKSPLKSTSPHLLKASLVAEFDSVVRDRRNSSMYRDVVPEELVTAEHGLEASVLEIADDDDGSLGSSLDEEWNSEAKSILIVDSSPDAEANFEEFNNNSNSFVGTTPCETLIESAPDSGSILNTPTQSKIL